MARNKLKRELDIDKMSDTEWQQLLDEVAGERATDVNPVQDPRFSRLINHPTPLGGDYAIAYFYDSEHNPCTEDNAKYVNTVAYTKGGVRVNENYGVLGE